jgi:putative flippase GtrA
MTKNLKTLKDKSIQLLRYSFVGINGTIIDIGSLAIMVDYFKFNLWVATFVAFSVAVIHNFIFNKYWTFKDQSKYFFNQYLKFLIVSVVGLIITITMMYIFTIFLGVWYIVSKLIISLFVLAWNFFANYSWTFKKNIFVDFNPRRLYEYSIVIPVYNESLRIEKTLVSITNYFLIKNTKVEIVIVDDGSKDNTIKVVENFFLRNRGGRLINYSCIKLDKNYGKGKAVKTGVLNSLGKYIIYLDADNATPISEIDNLLLEINSADIVIGSRKNSKIIEFKQPIHRRFLGKMRYLTTIFLIKDIKDTQCGFKLFKDIVAYNIFNQMTINRFGFDIEMLVLARVSKYNVKEVPVRWSHIKNSNVRFFKDSLLSFGDVVNIHINLITGKYK